MIHTKGAVLRATLDFVEREWGADTLEQVLQRLPHATREMIENCSPTAEVALPVVFTLWHAADDVLAAQDPEWMERAGAHSIESLGMQLYGGIVRKTTPFAFLDQPVSLFRLFYHGGDMEVVQREPGRAILRLVGFDQPDRLFCRRQTGGLQRALELAGGEKPAARHVRCVLEDDAFCEWELLWKKKGETETTTAAGQPGHG